MIPDRINNKILEKSISLELFGLYDLAWKKEDALILIKNLIDENIAVLGGDVYQITAGNLLSLGDNWYCEPQGNETKKEYLLRSKLHSINYIANYPAVKKKSFLFSISFSENVF